MYRNQSVSPESYTRPGSNADGGTRCPAPKTTGAAGTPLGSIGAFVLSSGFAVVMMADLMAIGDQSGFFARSRAARPATCGLAIDVPEIWPQTWPITIGPGGAAASITLTPGAVRSGLSRSPPPANAGP